uniref:Uncharacterized protein n=1 Tax=Aegilops tauschii subsp. strangulata TaxID=200361 RepID=A0A453LSB5_AEGTS
KKTETACQEARRGGRHFPARSMIHPHQPPLAQPPRPPLPLSTFTAPMASAPHPPRNPIQVHLHPLPPFFIHAPTTKVRPPRQPQGKRETKTQTPRHDISSGAEVESERDQIVDKKQQPWRRRPPSQ